MTQRPPLRPMVLTFALLVFSAVGVQADDYVWARSSWGVMPGGSAASSMTNGYGGYYVRKNSPGYNYEGQRFSNANAFVISAQPTTTYAPQQQYVQPYRHRRFRR